MKKRFRVVERGAADVIEAIKEMRAESEIQGRLMQAKEDAKNFYELGVEIEKIAQGVGYQ